MAIGVCSISAYKLLEGLPGSLLAVSSVPFIGGVAVSGSKSARRAWMFDGDVVGDDGLEECCHAANRLVEDQGPLTAH